MGSIDVDLMRRLVGILAGTKHKYIVSKGIRHSEYELAANMWGARSVPQLEILPHVDLVITHGGNNTFTEVIAQKKPMIVMPLFCDQIDNAQRIHEMNWGRRVDPYNFTDDELLKTIEMLLVPKNAELMAGLARLRYVGDRIQRQDQGQKMRQRIDSVLENYVHPE